MIRRPPRSTPLYSSAASDVYKRQAILLTPARRGEIVLGNALGILLHAMIPATIISLLLTAVFGFFSAGTIMYLLILCLSLSLLLTALVLIISILNRSIL